MLCENERLEKWLNRIAALEVVPIPVAARRDKTHPV